MGCEVDRIDVAGGVGENVRNDIRRCVDDAVQPGGAGAESEGTFRIELGDARVV